MLALSTLTMVSVLPVWLLAVGVLCAAYLVFRQRALPSFLRLLFVLAVVGFFINEYRWQFTVDTAVGFLFLSVSLKFLEMKSLRDVYLLVFVLLYLSAVSFLFSQTILHTALQLTVVLLAFGCLLGVNSVVQGGWSKRLWYNGKYVIRGLAIAVPLVIVLFLFFPRLSPLWSIPVKTQEATSGISDSMSPGDITRLGRSGERAFRVEFIDMGIPEPRQRYWRGIVLDRFDGESWSRSPQAEVRRRRIDRGFLADAEGAQYNVMLEPTNQRWAFTLQGSRSLSSHLFADDMGLFSFGTEIIQPTRYRLAYTGNESALVDIPTAQKAANAERVRSPSFKDLQLPRSGNPQTRQYVSQLRELMPNDVEFISYLMRLFSEEPFFYTLEPPPTGTHFTDDFLFSTKTGFCSHYAGSLAFMLRLAEIPARVVVGYQGGEYNEAGGYLLVHQYDAHAWVEAYVDSAGWIRLDPTAMVAPERISDSLQSAMGNESVLSADPVANLMRSVSWLNWTRLKLDELNYQWQKWVVNYNQDSQQRFFTTVLGGYSMWKIGAVLVGGILVVCGIVVFYFWWFRFSRPMLPAERKYLRLLRLLAVFGYHRAPSEPAWQFLERSIANIPGIFAIPLKKRTHALYQEVYASDPPNQNQQGVQN